nr:uncharacterized protein CG45076-like [Aegilops tauschii subsp. strangulata]
MGDTTPMETDDGSLDQSGPQPNTTPETHMAPESSEQPSSREGGVPTPPATSINPEVPDMLREALQRASVMEEHRTLMGTVVEKVQSAKSDLNEAFTSLLTGFEASLLAASAKDAEVYELQQKLKLADDEIDRINKRFNEAQGNATEVEALKSVLAEAKEEARASKAATEKAAADVEAEKAARLQYEARVAEVEQALQDAANKCESLEESNKAQAAELTKALQATKEAQSESRAAREEIKQAK